eukprot:COSAG01_NODE_11639_length_1891_cov_2.475446_1_plen_64_part_10
MSLVACACTHIAVHLVVQYSLPWRYQLDAAAPTVPIELAPIPLPACQYPHLCAGRSTREELPPP